ncbi:hypothetical protein VQ02_17330 [Methylobacterium variabile]|jgi:hypothetical protein|uniref:Uncharacterized protein n=1 Tax=Methylobacterium variabile TaxID=298794 RepID=A0A0J6SJI4_9HYPH|nr:hypothetical protein [Methylobacterium variabile]KMO35445.1 hypothetical protein VQ02_17330 [Methylobacterium variabile]
MVAVPFPTSSGPGAIPGEGSGRLVNVFAAKDGAVVRWYPVPGLDVVAQPKAVAPRGGLVVGASLYLAREDLLFVLRGDGRFSRVGALDGSKPVTMARNNRAPVPDVVAVTDVGAFVVTATGVQDYPGTVIGQPNSVSFLDGYFLFTYADGTIRASGTTAEPTNTTAMNDQSYTRAEAKPDGLLRGTVSAGQFFAWGASSVEVYDDAGTSPFPLARSAVIPVGLLGPWCVAGFEDGWDRQQIFVASDGTVRRLSGYQPEIVSTRAVERFIAAAPRPDSLRACVYTHGGNAIWALSSPRGTWEFNATVGEWNERMSRGQLRWRAETSIRFNNRWILGDVVTGDVLALNPAGRREAGETITSRIESQPLASFPARTRVSGLEVDITTGQGRAAGAAPIETDPSCLISWSHDGGMSWGNALQRPIGPPGVGGRRVSVGDLGRSTREGLRVAVEVSDPVPFVFKGADLPRVTVRKP